MKKWFKFVIAGALFPLCWALSRTFFFVLSAGSPHANNSWFLAAGAGAAALIFFLLPRAFRTYVLGHELTHALAGLLMGAKIGKIKVGRDGGHVELSKNNTIISLAPYVFPIYTALFIAIWLGVQLFYDLRAYEPFGLAIVGFTWGYHAAFTIYMLLLEQPDIEQNGRLYSYVIIYAAHLGGLLLSLVLWGDMTLSGSWNIFLNELAGAYGACGEQIQRLWTAGCLRTTHR